MMPGNEYYLIVRTIWTNQQKAVSYLLLCEPVLHKRSNLLARYIMINYLPKVFVI